MGFLVLGYVCLIFFGDLNLTLARSFNKVNAMKTSYKHLFSFRIKMEVSFLLVSYDKHNIL